MDVLTFRIHNVTTEILGLKPEQALAINSFLRYRLSHFRFVPSYRKGHWDGFIKLFKKNRFPTGLFRKTLNFVQSWNLPIQIVVEDLREPLPVSAEDPITFTLRDYQQEALEAISETWRGVIRLPTGSGKTIVIASILGKLGVPTLVLTHRVILLNYLSQTISKALGKPVGILGDGRMDLQPITIGSIQTVVKRLESAKAGFGKEAMEVQKYVKDDIRCVITDETHHVSSSNSIQYILNRCMNATSRIGLSATPYRDSEIDLWLEGCIGPQRYYLSASNLIKRGYLSKPYIFFVDYGKTTLDITCPKCNEVATEALIESKCPKCGHKVLSDRFLYEERAEKGEFDFLCPKCTNTWLSSSRKAAKQTYIICSKDKCNHRWTPFQNAKRRGITDNSLRNLVITQIAIRRIQKRRSVLIYLEQIKHGQLLEEAIGKVVGVDQVKFLWSDIDDKEGWLKKLERKEILCIISTTVLGEGVDIPSLDTLMNVKAGESPIELIQIVGRVLRRTPKKHKVLVLDFDDKFQFFKRKAKARKEILKLEPEFVVRSYKYVPKEIK